MKPLILYILLVVLILTSCSPAITPTPGPLAAINACYSSASATQAVAWFALEKKLFEKYGLQVNLLYIASGSKAVTALLSGDVDICVVASSAVVNAVAAGQDAVMIAGLYNTYPASLYVTPDIKTPADLKGKTLAVSQPGSATTSGTMLVLRKMGLIPGQDVSLISLGDDSERFAAIRAGRASGALMVPPQTLEAQQLGYVQLFNLGTSGIPYLFSGIATKRSFIESNRPVVMAFMKAIVEAIVDMKNNPESTKAVLAKYMGLDPQADAPQLDEAYNLLIRDALETVPYPSLPGVQTVIGSLVETNPNVTKITPEQVVDISILEELKQNGFIDSLSK